MAAELRNLVPLNLVTSLKSKDEDDGDASGLLLNTCKTEVLKILQI